MYYKIRYCFVTLLMQQVTIFPVIYFVNTSNHLRKTDCVERYDKKYYTSFYLKLKIEYLKTSNTTDLVIRCTMIVRKFRKLKIFLFFKFEPNNLKFILKIRTV